MKTLFYSHDKKVKGRYVMGASQSYKSNSGVPGAGKSTGMAVAADECDREAGKAFAEHVLPGLPI